MYLAPNLQVGLYLELPEGYVPDSMWLVIVCRKRDPDPIFCSLLFSVWTFAYSIVTKKICKRTRLPYEELRHSACCYAAGWCACSQSSYFWGLGNL